MLEEPQGQEDQAVAVLEELLVGLLMVAMEMPILVAVVEAHHHQRLQLQTLATAVQAVQASLS